MMRFVLLTAVLAVALSIACGGDKEPPQPPGAGAEAPSAAQTAQAPSPAPNAPDAVPRPPPATASAGGQTAAMGIGTYCWAEAGKVGLCLDAAGPVTSANPLQVARSAIVTVANPAGATVQRASVNVWPAPAQPSGSTRSGELTWNLAPNTSTTRPGVTAVTITAAGVEFAANLDPGRYVVELRLFFAAGDVSYGLLLEVR